MSHEVLNTRIAFLIFLKIQAEAGLRRAVLAGASWYWILPGFPKKIKILFVFLLSGPHGTSNFDHQSLIRSDLNYTNG